MLSLKSLLTYPSFLIQCHDSPDADAIACAFALSRYFKAQGKPCRLVYGGFSPITKPNLAAMIQALAIPLDFVGQNPQPAQLLIREGPPLLITVDCQHGAGNVTKIACEDVCVIDHHIKETDLARHERIEPYLGSCATVIWRMLREAGFDFGGGGDVETALYYGLFSDTNSLAELYHPIDRDMLESLNYDRALIKRLKGSILTREEILVAGRALSGASFDEELHTALFEAEPCDPNILGYINDLAMQVDQMDTCIGFCRINGGVKLSLRSGTIEIMANELAAYLTRELGSGGGSRDKAGGFFRPAAGEGDIKGYLLERIREYHQSCDKLVAGEDKIDTSAMKQYRKKSLTVGYVVLADLYPEGTEVTVRTLEGDASFSVSADTYLMVGVQGEVYPISREKFNSGYQALEGAFSFLPEVVGDGFYQPTVRDRLYGRSLELPPHTRPCRATGRILIYARRLERSTKVFSRWYPDGYMLGRPGDYLAVRQDDPGDCYIINSHIFALTYEDASPV